MERQIRYNRPQNAMGNAKLEVVGIDKESPYRIFTVQPTWPKPFWPELRDLLRRFGHEDYTAWADLVKRATEKPNQWIVERIPETTT